MIGSEKMNIYEQNANFYYIYSPLDRLESFIFFDGAMDLNIDDIMDENGQPPQMYPLGYLLSKWFLFYKTLVENSQEDGQHNNYKCIFSKYFPDSHVLTDTLGCNTSVLDTFLFFVVNNDILFNDYAGEYQKLEHSSVTNIFNFVNHCIGNKQYNTLDNLAKIRIANDDLKEMEYKILYPPMKRKHKSYHNNTISILDTNQMTELLKNDEKQVLEYHCYKVSSIKEYLYAVLTVIFSSGAMIKKCKFCGQIFVPQNYRSANYCKYRIFDGQERNCYEQHKYESIMYNEQNNRCTTEEKRIRNRLLRWVEYFNGGGEEYEQRRKTREYWNNKIEEKRGLYNQKIITEEEYYNFLISIPKAKNL